MSQLVAESSGGKKEVSESSLEYLIGEILNFEHPAEDENTELAVSQRLEKIGYDVGYRFEEIRIYLTSFELL
jgi:hypothetical protein